MSIILHIGLHKTGTKFFQHKVFPYLDDGKYIYKPEKLDQLVLDYLKADDVDKPTVLPVLKAEVETLQKKNPGKKILMSREAMAGNLFSAYKYWEYSIDLLAEAFPNAMILIFLRNQTDWLVSCYRESIHEHHYQPISDFLSYNQNKRKFIVPKKSRNKAGFACLNSLNLDYSLMLKKLFNRFSKNQVKTFFFEDFKKTPQKTIRDLLQSIGSDDINIRQNDEIPNRGYSALSIDLSIKRYEILKERGMTNYVHRPIFFYGKGSIPSGNITLSVLDKEKYWGNKFLRDNEEVRSPNYPDINEQERKDFEASWRYTVKNVLDKHNYVDWDVLGDLRPRLVDHYKNLNSSLKNLLQNHSIPNEY